MSAKEAIESKEESSKVEQRAPRKPYERKTILPYPQISGFHTRWVNEIVSHDEMRITSLTDAWWDVVYRREVFGNNDPKAGSPYQVKAGGGIIATYMKIKEDLWNEDQMVKQRAREADLRGIVRNKPGEVGHVSKVTARS